jgi:RNA polymerase sigma-70 factor (ECF subfamily)
MTKILRQRDVFGRRPALLSPGFPKHRPSHMKPAIAPNVLNFEQVVRAHWIQIFHFVLGSVRDREVAADLTQDCFWKAYRGWSQFRGDASVHTWLRHIALNTIRNFARSNRIQFWRRAPFSEVATIEDLLPHPSPSPEAKLFRRERLQAIWIAARSLPSRQQTAFILRFGGEMELPEIAESMRVTEGAVKAHLFRAVQSLRKTVGTSGGPGNPLPAPELPVVASIHKEPKI